jgi:hypothetical protein
MDRVIEIYDRMKTLTMRGPLLGRLLESMDPQEVSNIMQNHLVAIEELGNSSRHLRDHKGLAGRTASVGSWSR